jgi:FtsP/CotA-like multicopper oxidase with cupredoxin domain
MPIRPVCTALILVILPAVTSAQSTARISANDNRKPGGTITDGVLSLNLVAEHGEWQPEGTKGRTLSVYAFREEPGSLLIPGPLMRVTTGTEIHVSIRNAIDTTLQVFGLQNRPATTANAIVVKGILPR